MIKIIELAQIKKILGSVDIIPAIEEGFIAYSKQQAVIPPVGELIFNDPPGDVHIKYGYLHNDDFYVIKVASGFYHNPKLNIPSSNGLMMLFNQKTGEPLAILLDEGYLTNLRTAAAGAIAAKYLAPRKVNRIGIVGTGIQAKLQLHYLQKVVNCNNVIVFGRNQHHLAQFQTDMQGSPFNIKTTLDLNELTSTCNLITTTTPSTTPILYASDILAGTHITAVGADTPHKQELEETILSRADIVVADSISQCMERGDISHAIQKNIIPQDKLVELGNIVSHPAIGRRHDQQITVADLTGLAVQDIQIAKIVYKQAILPN